MIVLSDTISIEDSWIRKATLICSWIY